MHQWHKYGALMMSLLFAWKVIGETFEWPMKWNTPTLMLQQFNAVEFGKQKPIDFQRYHFRNGRLAEILDASVSRL